MYSSTRARLLGSSVAPVVGCLRYRIRAAAMCTATSGGTSGIIGAAGLALGGGVGRAGGEGASVGGVWRWLRAWVGGRAGPPGSRDPPPTAGALLAAPDSPAGVD